MSFVCSNPASRKVSSLDLKSLCVRAMRASWLASLCLSTFKSCGHVEDPHVFWLQIGVLLCFITWMSGDWEAHETRSIVPVDILH
jgi:hypothetical protein